ncbi:MAG: tyrosine-type recombinase/integrase [Ruminiclostridium sp.]
MNRHPAAYTRKGISYIFEKYEKRAREVSSLLPDLTISPHIFRHSKAMHLYQAGIDLIYIRDILGHVDISTMEVYARVDTERKHNALENAYPEITGSTLTDWNDDEDLIRKLSRLV